MEVSLEQFISADKPKKLMTILKRGGIVLFIIGFLQMMSLSLTMGLIMEVIAIIIFLSGFYSYVDYEYELFNGNIDISKIYSCSRRKTALKISQEQVVRIYPTSRNDIGKNGAKVFFNSNIKGLTVYTIELQGQKKVQIAFNEELEKMIKIIYRPKLTY